jgi:two-component system, OmpR family, sensor kinase
MSIRNSIRYRIQVWHGSLLLAVCAGFGITAYQLERANLMRHVDQELETRLGVLTNALSREGGGRGSRPPPPPEGETPPKDRPRPPGFRSDEVIALFSYGEQPSFFYQAWSRHGGEIARSATAPDGIPLPDVTRVFGKSIRTRDGFREVYLFTPPGECLLAGRSLAGVKRELHGFAWKLTGIGVAVLVFGLAVGWWIASRALRPISQISEAAARIAGGNLKERIRTSETESELGRLASVLDDTFQRLDAAFEEQARFTSDAAHELRTPVSIILAQSQVALAKERSADDYRDSIGMFQRAAIRMHSLIESLLQLAVLDSSAASDDSAPCDLGEIAMEQVALMRPLADEKNVTLVAEITAAPCHGDAGQLGSIVANLLGNAVKFCPAGATVRLSAATDRGRARLIVSDNGPGIPARHLPHLFERFYRVESSRNRASGGAGLGLAICKRIAERHGGGLEVQSSEGEGATFTLSIPVGVQS